MIYVYDGIKSASNFLPPTNNIATSIVYVAFFFFGILN